MPFGRLTGSSMPRSADDTTCSDPTAGPSILRAERTRFAWPFSPSHRARPLTPGRRPPRGRSPTVRVADRPSSGRDTPGSAVDGGRGGGWREGDLVAQGTILQAGRDDDRGDGDGHGGEEHQRQHVGEGGRVARTSDQPAARPSPAWSSPIPPAGRRAGPERSRRRPCAQRRSHVELKVWCGNHRRPRRAAGARPSARSRRWCR